MKQYYVAKNGVQEGPYEEAALKADAAAGKYPKNTIIWCEGMDDWEPIGEHFQLPSAAPTPKPQPAPEPVPEPPPVSAQTYPMPPTPAPMPGPPPVSAQTPPVPPAASTASYTFGQAIAACFKRYAEFDGRASRSEYWWFCLFANVLACIPFIGEILALGLIVPGIAVAIRRMHDIGKCGWFCIIPIYSLILAAQESSGPNKYGPGPKKVDEK